MLSLSTSAEQYDLDIATFLNDSGMVVLETNLTIKKITFKSVCYVYVDEEKDLWEIIESFDLSW